MKKSPGSLQQFRSELRRLSDDSLIARFNGDVGHNGWTGARSRFLVAMHDELLRRNWDASAICNEHEMSMKYRIKLVDGKILTDKDAH